MKNRKTKEDKIFYILHIFGQIVGIFMIVLGITMFCLFKATPLLERSAGSIGIIMMGALLFFVCLDMNKKVKDVENMTKLAKDHIKRAFDKANPREVIYISSLRCDEAKMLNTIITNSKVQFYASLNDDGSVIVTAICSQKSVYQENISNPVYFTEHFYFIKLDNES